MNAKFFVMMVGLVTLAWLLGWNIGRHSGGRSGIPPRIVADYLHAVIEADRTFYTQHVVDRMEAMLIVTASEHWREDRSLPLPAQFLREASRNLHVRGAPFRYRLISLWPLNPENSPESDQERQALEHVMKYGEVVETEVVNQQGQRYFKAIYPDRAVSRACVACHNAHPRSKKRDFKLNDVMGGLVIQIPVDDPTGLS
ncbi:MAG: DUF3365 domain-containing protein [Nitrospirae bacterium]|nr:MAG: DUF3365 domain-containing protein [Nitrospirota bacterium]